MAYRSAPLVTLLRQVNELHPLRDTRSDGWIGDSSHGARPSDHNPDPPVVGVVRAQDFDADGPAGFDLDGWLWGQLLEHRDPRISYVISRGRMFSSYPARGYDAWEDRPYHGDNGHFGHLHVSTTKASDKDGRPWRLDTEDFMPTADEIATAVWGKLLPKFENVGPASAASFLGHAAYHAAIDTLDVTALRTELAKVESRLTELLEGQAQITPEQAQAAVRAGVAEAILDAGQALRVVQPGDNPPKEGTEP